MSLPQLVLDADLIRMDMKALEGMDVSEETIALDVIREVGIRGNFLDEDHTLDHYREQTNPVLFQRGVKNEDFQDIYQKAKERAIEILEKYRNTLSVSQEVADKIHQMVIEAEEKELNLKYGKVD